MAIGLAAAGTIWLQVVATTLVAGGCSLVVAWWRLRPAGSLFHIFAFAAIASIPNQPPLWQGMLVGVLTVAFCPAARYVLPRGPEPPDAVGAGRRPRP